MPRKREEVQEHPPTIYHTVGGYYRVTIHAENDNATDADIAEGRTYCEIELARGRTKHEAARNFGRWVKSFKDQTPAIERAVKRLRRAKAS